MLQQRMHWPKRGKTYCWLWGREQSAEGRRKEQKEPKCINQFQSNTSWTWPRSHVSRAGSWQLLPKMLFLLWIHVRSFWNSSKDQAQVSHFFALHKHHTVATWCIRRRARVCCYLHNKRYASTIDNRTLFEWPTVLRIHREKESRKSCKRLLSAQSGMMKNWKKQVCVGGCRVRMHTHVRTFAHTHSESNQQSGWLLEVLFLPALKANERRASSKSGRWRYVHVLMHTRTYRKTPTKHCHILTWFQ